MWATMFVKTMWNKNGDGDEGNRKSGWMRDDDSEKGRSGRSVGGPTFSH